ncbi:hypothetical protein CBW18_15555 [Pedobacter sp. AJM]|nr:hypothetical protein CBW18_15555 [Pedobacter sp. AJM]
MEKYDQLDIFLHEPTSLLHETRRFLDETDVTFFLRGEDKYKPFFIYLALKSLQAILYNYHESKMRCY